MGKVILLCGKICSGKTHYAARLLSETGGVLLSCDEIMFGLDLDRLLDYLEDVHAVMIPKIQHFLYKKATEIVIAGPAVVLDFGFWSRQERKAVSKYFSDRHIPYEWHYIHVSRETWAQNIAERNRNRPADTAAYELNDRLLAKMERQFEEPLPGEVDVWFNNERV